MKKLRIMIIGAGNRGNRYAKHMSEHPDKYEIVAMADPQAARREHFNQVYGVPADKCFNSWEEILAQPKMADIAVISTVDTMHYEPAMKAIEVGYDLLLEKPVCPTPEECVEIANAANAKGVNVLVCHVLRYTPFYGKVKQLVMDGVIGDIVSVEQTEAIGNVHFGHSFVRGNWKNTDVSAPMLLAKCCHDLDIIQWLVGKDCTRVQSFGSLTHFTPENAPEGAPVRCADGGCPVGDTCPYSCLKQYYEDKTNRRRKVVAAGYCEHFIPNDDEVMAALKVKDYGLCVYHANNNMVDHQTVNMEFEGGVTATLTMNAFNKGGRYVRLYGTKGEIYAYMKDDHITVYTFEDDNEYTVPVLKTDETINGGHGGGDEGIVKEIYDYFSDSYNGFRAADINVSVKNHLIGYAAEEARHEGTVVDVNAYMDKCGYKR